MFHAEIAIRLGYATFQTLLLRAFVMSMSEFPYLDQVTSEAASRCSFEALREPLERQNPPVEEALTAVLANLIWLFIKFIGYRYTLHILHEVWPHVSVEEAQSFLKL